MNNLMEYSIKAGIIIDPRSALEHYDNGTFAQFVVGWWDCLHQGGPWTGDVICWLHGAAMAVPLQESAVQAELQFLRNLIQDNLELYIPCK